MNKSLLRTALLVAVPLALVGGGFAMAQTAGSFAPTSVVVPTTDPITGQLIDATTGWVIDPATGWPIDPATGLPTDPSTIPDPTPTPTPTDPAACIDDDVDGVDDSDDSPDDVSELEDCDASHGQHHDGLDDADGDDDGIDDGLTDAVDHGASAETLESGQQPGQPLVDNHHRDRLA